jgi:hypothetical protein
MFFFWMVRSVLFVGSWGRRGRAPKKSKKVVVVVVLSQLHITLYSSCTRCCDQVGVTQGDRVNFFPISPSSESLTKMDTTSVH